MADPGDRGGGGSEPVSALEIVVSGAGLVLTLGLLAFIAWEAFTQSDERPPAVVVEARRVVPAGDLWVVEFEARNLTARTAAEVEIEGTLIRHGREVATARAVLEHVPARSSARGGLFLDVDPAGYELRLRALGYADP